MRTKISTKIQVGYLRQQETNEDGAQGTHLTERKKRPQRSKVEARQAGTWEGGGVRSKPV